ncbi:MAG: ABC transporter substrate-binding protein, partial [Chloroflexi bacterium]|nr:ABC transporter substrate-binding protein [Chloroflexota bacterium]
MSVAPAPPAVAQAAAAVTKIQPLPQRAKVTFQINVQPLYYLPLLYAADKGYLDKAGLDMDFKTQGISTGELLPMLARGDLDALVGSNAPGLYNQMAQGFDIKAISSYGDLKQGRAEPLLLTVKKDAASQIKTLADLKG